MVPQPPGQSVFELQIHLEGVTPIIWRRLLVPGSVRLSTLHDIFQAAMGWTNSHLHCFRIGGELYGTQFDDYPDQELDESGFSAVQVLRDQTSFVYEYDFGDSWEHEVVVTGRTTMRLGLKFAVCLDGQNACPPEDCGGVHGFAQMLEAVADPAHDEHDHYVTWLGGEFDPTAFDLAATNAALQRIR